MSLDKTDLMKSINMLNMEQSSPFIGVHLVEGELPKFFRSGATGFIRSSDAKGGDEWVFSSFSHLLDSLKVLADAQITLTVERGTLKITAVQDMYETELYVYTVKKEAACMKVHKVGTGKLVDIPSTAFLGFNSNPFSLAAPPVVEAGKVFLPTAHAIINWTSPSMPSDVKRYPCRSFLNSVSGKSIVSMMVTDAGYWGAEVDGFTMFQCGHTLGKHLYTTYSQATLTEVGRLPAERLVYALRSAAKLSEPNAKVEVSPQCGIVSRDKYGSQSKFSVAPGKWQSFSLLGNSAKVVVDAFSQTKDDEVVMYDAVISGARTVCFRRGSWDVFCKVF